MIYYLNSMMPSDVLGRRGYNDRLNPAYWISVLRCVISPNIKPYFLFSLIEVYFNITFFQT